MLGYSLYKSLGTLQASAIYRPTRQFISAASERNFVTRNAMYMQDKVETL
jgi:hypothetical protein